MHGNSSDTDRHAFDQWRVFYGQIVSICKVTHTIRTYAHCVHSEIAVEQVTVTDRRRRRLKELVFKKNARRYRRTCLEIYLVQRIIIIITITILLKAILN